MTKRTFRDGVLVEETVDPGDARTYERSALAGSLRDAAMASVTANQQLVDLLAPQIAYAHAVAVDQSADIPTAQLLAVVKNLANILEGTARGVSTCLEQLKAHSQLIVGTYWVEGTGGPGPINTGE